jgi:hypothetical protein
MPGFFFASLMPAILPAAIRGRKGEAAACRRETNSQRAMPPGDFDLDGMPEMAT